MTVRNQLKLAMILFYFVGFFSECVGDVAIAASALLMTVGILGYLVGTRPRAE